MQPMACGAWHLLLIQSDVLFCSLQATNLEEAKESSINSSFERQTSASVRT